MSGIGASGSFQLADQFFPSPAILAGDSSDEDEEDFEDSDEYEREYVPRPTKRGRLAKRPVPKQAPEPVRSGKPKPRRARKGKERNSKASPAKYYEVSSEGESDEEMEEVEYTPKSTKKRGGVATPAKKAAPVQEVKSTSRSRGKSVPAKKESGKPKRAAAKSPVVESDDSDEEVVPSEYTPRPSKSRGGASSEKRSTTPKSGLRTRTPAKRKLVEVSDADDDDSDAEIPPPKKQRGKVAKESPKVAAQTPKSQSSKSRRKR